MTPPATSRLFLALWPGERTRTQLVARQAALQWPAGARVVAPANLHLTLHFIGAVPVEQVPALAASLRVATRRIELPLDGFEVWRGGIAALVPERCCPALLDLHGRLADGLRAQGLPVEVRPYRPHVTLARRADGAVVPQGLAPVHWRSEGYVLALSAAGQYSVLARYR